MSWWAWILIAAGVVALGAVKLSFFNAMKKRKAEKRKFTDED